MAASPLYLPKQESAPKKPLFIHGYRKALRTRNPFKYQTLAEGLRSYSTKRPKGQEKLAL